ncbi:putative N-acetylmannosamine-6-phosphate 2-epimerase [Amphibiibacter pelophylacis]|uniref:N-acetylmannosamine-6-phosphate 2-epimerase n=1 Tax=Amphibiibacter pelophylacis TaxID=1799477 RepID=A0ACC6P214_9BURK
MNHDVSTRSSAPSPAPTHPTWQRLGLSLPALIVSCQAVPDGPFDTPPFIRAFALAALQSGAQGLRLEGVENVRTVRADCDCPIIGIVKRDLADSPVRITPFVHDVQALAEAGATVIAVDATDRVRPQPVAELLAAIHAAGCLAMADISTLEEARAAQALGFDVIGTTMSGYTGGPVPEGPDLVLVQQVAALGVATLAEGRLNSPQAAADAVRCGAQAVVVGSAISRPEYITSWYRQAVDAAAAAGSSAQPGAPVLALDIGGTKTLVARVENGVITHELQFPTQRGEHPDQWLAQALAVTQGWPGGWTHVAAAVTGVVGDDGLWTAFNPQTLDFPPYPLVQRLREVFGVPALALNDAQAAAWGEARCGAGQGDDLMFVTVSTGIGAGLVLDSRLRRGPAGIAGHLGQWRDDAGHRLEDIASGSALGRQAVQAGWPGGAPELVERARHGEPAAQALLQAGVDALAQALARVQLLLDVPTLVLGGGLGLAPGYAPLLEAALAQRLGPHAPQVRPAALGAHAGILGAALCPLN